MDDLIRVFESGSAAEVRHVACSRCGGALRVAFTPGRKAAVGVVCKSCRSGFCSDGIAAEPPWVSELGPEFETAPSIN